MVWSKSSKLSAFAALFCLCFVFAYGVGNLKTDPIRNDEFRTLNHVEPVWLTQSRTISETIQSVAVLSPQHGPLYFLILNVWHKLAGSDLFSLRLLSVLFGVMSVAMIYRLALIFGNRADATAAAWVLSFLAFNMFFVQYLRMYTLLLFATGLALWSYWIVRRSKSQRPWVWLLLITAIALLPYIHYFGGLIVAAMGTYHAASFSRHRRWWLILAAFAAGILAFAPWLPVVLSGLAEHRLDQGAATARLTSVEAMRAVVSILSNGILPVAPFAAGLALVRFRRMNAAERYLAFVALFTAVALFALNEVAPVLVENRMRYVLVLALPYCCLVVIALRKLQSGNTLRIGLLACWCLTFFYYLGTDDYATFTNILQHETRKIPRYQEFIYESEKIPGRDELILSFHADMVLSANKTLEYYRKMLPAWAYIAHITYDESDELLLQSDYSKYGSLDAIAANSRAVWVIHDPEQTTLTALPVYSEWFLEHFKWCKRYHEAESTSIDYYVIHSIPCELINSEPAFTVHYDNGFVLGNAITVQNESELEIYLWWDKTFSKAYSLSIQVFDQAQEKVRQVDAVISGEPIDVFKFDLADLAAGEYQVDLIVYHFESRQTVPGRATSEFERAVELLGFEISE